MMAAQVTWSDELLINVAAIDSDHRKLFDLMRDIFTTSSHGADAISRAVGALEKYTREHFAREEESMAKTNYPGLSAQKYEHEHLVFTLESMMYRLMSSGPEAIDADLAKFLTSWLGDHIMNFDLKYAEYLKANNLEG